MNPIGNISPRLNKLISHTSRIANPTSECSAAQSTSAVSNITPINIARTIILFIQGFKLFSDIFTHLFVSVLNIMFITGLLNQIL